MQFWCGLSCTLSVVARRKCCALAAQVVGIMLGMLSLGFIADKVGRKWGSVACAAFMFVGGILLTASSAPTLYGWAVMFSVSQARSAAARRASRAGRRGIKSVMGLQRSACVVHAFGVAWLLAQSNDAPCLQNHAFLACKCRESIGELQDSGHILTCGCACGALQFIYGYGVGGEYPLASSSAAERAEANKSLRFRRGEMIVCTFAMQACTGCVMLACTCGMRHAPCIDATSLAPAQARCCCHGLTAWSDTVPALRCRAGATSSTPPSSASCSRSLARPARATTTARWRPCGGSRSAWA